MFENLKSIIEAIKADEISYGRNKDYMLMADLGDGFINLLCRVEGDEAWRAEEQEYIDAGEVMPDHLKFWPYHPFDGDTVFSLYVYAIEEVVSLITMLDIEVG